MKKALCYVLALILIFVIISPLIYLIFDIIDGFEAASNGEYVTKSSRDIVAFTLLVTIIEAIALTAGYFLIKYEPGVLNVLYVIIFFAVLFGAIYFTYLGFAKAYGWLWLGVPLMNLLLYFILCLILYHPIINIAIFFGQPLIAGLIALILWLLEIDVPLGHLLPFMLFWIIFCFFAGKAPEPPKNNDASVIKRGVVGYAIAGPVGAIVGALSAIDKNNRNK